MTIGGEGTGWALGTAPTCACNVNLPSAEAKVSSLGRTKAARAAAQPGLETLSLVIVRGAVVGGPSELSESSGSSMTAAGASQELWSHATWPLPTVTPPASPVELEPMPATVCTEPLT